MIMQLEKLPSIGLEQTIAIDTRVQQAVLENVPEVAAIVARASSDELGLDPMGLNQTDSFLVLKPRDTWRVGDREWLAEQLRPGHGRLSGHRRRLHAADRHARRRNADRGAWRTRREDFRTRPHTLNRLAGEIGRLSKGQWRAGHVHTENDGVQYLKVAVDRLAAGRLGLNVDDIQSDLKSLLEGRQVGTIIETGDARRSCFAVRKRCAPRLRISKAFACRCPVAAACR